jgi:hypothetical protein
MTLRPHASILVLAVTLVLQGCASAPPSPAGTKAQDAQLPATAADTKQQLDALFENYFEDNLRANPLLATYIGDHRYDDQLPNSIGPQYLAAAHEMNRKYLAAIRAIDPDSLSPADRISYDIFLYEREREARSERFPFHLLPINQAGAGLGHQRAAVRDSRGLRTLVAAAGRAGRLDGPGGRQHAGRRGQGRRATACRHGEGARPA